MQIGAAPNSGIRSLLSTRELLRKLSFRGSRARGSPLATWRLVGRMRRAFTRPIAVAGDARRVRTSGADPGALPGQANSRQLRKPRRDGTAKNRLVRVATGAQLARRNRLRVSNGRLGDE
jgi:hypothetical protein